MSETVFPVPREVEMVGGTGAALDVDVDELTDPTLPTQGYELTVRDGAVVLVAADEAGMRYGRDTLAQLREAARSVGAAEIAAVAIRDHPDFVSRGFMLDISRDRVPTMATLDRLVELLALARYNELQLYMEHTFAYADHEVVWRDASPMTAEEIRWLDARCAEAGIELVPNQNTFGHMGRWLAHDRYRERAYAPSGFELMPGVRMPPGVLAPTPENAAFAHGLLEELLENFTSRRVNIGCDETFELDDVDAYLEHVLRIAAPLLADNYEVEFWADVVQRDPDRLAALPDGMVPVVWNYEAPRLPGNWPDLGEDANAALARLGLGPDFVAGFGVHLESIVETGVPFRVAPGTSSWNSLVGRTDNAVANLRDAAAYGRAHGATGYLVTDWGDNGHLQPPPVSFGPLLDAGALAWCTETNHAVRVRRYLERFVAEIGDEGSTVDEIGMQWGLTGQWSVNASPLLAALCPGQVHLVLGEPNGRELAEIIDVLDQAVGSLSDPSLANATRLARHGAWRLMRRAGGEVPRQSRLRKDLAEAIADYDECWAMWSRPGGLADSRAQLTATLAEYD